MRNVFKSKINYKNKMGSKIIVGTIILIIILTIFLLSKFNKEMNNSLINISTREIKRVTYSIINERLNRKIMNEDNLEDILVITKDQKGKILMVDFNLDRAYKLLDKISGVLTETLKSTEGGNIDIQYLDYKMSHKTNSLILNIPLGSILKSTYFYNFGPLIPVKINYIGSVLTNLHTKITNYGLNNALVEVFVYVKLNNEVITPFKVHKEDLEYDSLIASMMIEGEVPSFYNGEITKESGIYKTNIE